MQSYTKVTGLVCPLDRANVDTDQIIPAVYLKRIERTGFGQFLFASWRFVAAGKPNPQFVLNFPQYQGATILVTGPNFGSGSSREHAVWALLDYGFRTVIAPSFADIFRNNCYQNGVLPVILPQEAVDHIMRQAQTEKGYQLSVDLEQQRVSDAQGFQVAFEMDPFRRRCLLNGLDDIGLTLQHQGKIAAYERARAR